MKSMTYALILCLSTGVATPTTAESTQPLSEAAPADRAGLSSPFQDPEQVLDVLRNKYLAKSPEQPSAPGPPLVLDAHRCVELALERNAQVFISEEKVEMALARIGQARSQRLPQATGRAALSHIENDQFDQGLGGFTYGTSDVAPSDDTLTTELKLRQTLYAGGQIRAAIKSSKYLARSEEWQKEAALHQLEFEAKQAYYDCLFADALVRVAQEGVRTFQRHLTDTQQMFNVGMVSRFEVLRAQTELGARKADAVAAQNGRRLALANLRRILALPQETPVDLAADLARMPISASMAQLVGQALEKRPELWALKNAVQAARQDVKRAKGQFKPNVAAAADWVEVDGGSSFTQDGWTFTLGAEWDLYTGGRRKHETAEAKARLRSLEHQIEDLQRLVELDVTRAYIQIEDAMAQIQSDRGNVELGREGLRLAELRFQEGVGTQAETLDAELALTNSDTALVQALRDYAVAHAALEKAIGKAWYQEKPDLEGDILPEPQS